MELPLGTEGRKATHDFLSLYSSSAAHTQQDPSPPQGGYLKTHDFLQPLERVEKNVTMKKEDITAGVASVDRPPAAAVEHILPGGIGTYSISYFNQMVLNPAEGGLFTAPAQPSRNDDNSNCTSYSGSSFTLWDNESANKKGKTGKENTSAETHILREAGVNVVGGQCTPFLEKQSHSSPNHRHNAANFSSFTSSQPSSSQKNQSFMDMVTTSAKNDLKEEEEDDEEDISIKKESSSHSKGNLSVKVEAKTIDPKPNTPRSKHSATEQRRRSKINDRFHKLREIIPNSDQKRDKASFLLEVIEYIQLLQEKVNRYESSCNVWNQEPSKIMHWQRKCHINEGLVSSDCAPAATMFGKSLEQGKDGVSLGLPLGESEMSSGNTVREEGKGVVDKTILREEEVVRVDEMKMASVGTTI